MGTNFKKGRKKTNDLHKGKKLPSDVTLFSKLNIESEQANAVNTTENYHNTLTFLCFRQKLFKKMFPLTLDLV